jgi:hypothetical protein
MNMTRNQKTARPTGRNPAYRQAFERLDTALAKNTPSHYVIEQINRVRRILFGIEEVEEPEPPAESSAQNQEIYPGKSG